ncbi:MAG: winged helix-turn-helix transcriptional regulator, partial [Bryobacterales bacterium]|nr:winged helix-turn-helix transcriptional regulator [Bryobacterales bacterium]
EFLQIARTRETPAAADIMQHWWVHAPWAFRAVRDSAGATGGFYLFLELRDQRLPQIHEDPLLQAWRRHLKTHPIASTETAVFLRRWLSSTHGELPSPVQAACWLDAKRSYMELRPHLRRCYLSLCDLETYGPTAQALGFQIVEDASVTLDGTAHHLAVLDFGPGSVDAWLTRLVAIELGVDPPGLLDLESRELTLDGRRIALTALEFDLLRYLQERPGRSVARDELLEQVWHRRPDSSSNVVDVLVRSLRRKMGTHAAQLVTVRGHGYRLETH